VIGLIGGIAAAVVAFSVLRPAPQPTGEEPAQTEPAATPVG
jgi:hypothetical protein